MERICKIRVLDEVYVAFIGLTGEDIKYFHNKYSAFAANYFFNPKFKLGRWDGKIHFFEENGRTFLYFLEDIIPQIVARGYTLQLDDLRTSNLKTPELVHADTFSYVINPKDGNPVKLRYYQIDSVNELLTQGYGIIQAATGSGKTLKTAALVNAWGNVGHKTITIVPDGTLVSQTKATYTMCGLDVGEYSGTEKTLEHQHIVSTWQALQNNPNVILQFQVVICDECHGLRGSVLKGLVLDYASSIPHRYGVTGTLPPEKCDEMAVLSALGPVRYTVTAKQLIDEGILASVHIDILQLEENLTTQYADFCDHPMIGKPPTYTQFKDGYFPDFSSEKSYLQRNTDRIQWIAYLIMANADKNQGNTLCLVDSIPFGRQLSKMIPNSIFVNGQDVKKISDRQKVYKLFEERDDLVVIATVHIAGTGLDIPRVNFMYLIDVGKSAIRVLQGIGRGLRTAHDKKSVQIVDVTSDLKYSKKHTTARTNIYKNAQYPYKKHKIDYTKYLE